MKKKVFIILGIIIVLLGVLIDSAQPKEIDWSESYHEKNANPFDLEVFYEQLPSVFKDKKVITLKNTFYEFQEENYTTTLKTNNIYLNIDVSYKPDITSEEKLLEFIGRGNVAFISATYFSKSLLDSLKIKNNTQTESLFNIDSLAVTTIENKKTFTYNNKLKYKQTYFKDSTNIQVLGRISYHKNDTLVNKANFITIPYKKGLFYLHTQPEVFTNYHLLNAPNTDYINSVLSNIPESINNKPQANTALLFESNYKAADELINSPLRFIKSKQALKTAWYLLLLAVLLFLLINAKRKQRIIPIIPKVQNTSLEFVKTIATLYEDADNFQDIIQQKINIFYRKVRSTYNLTTDTTNTKLAKQLSLKSGYDLEKTKELIRLINVLKNRETSSFTLLKTLNTEIEKFTKNTNAWKN